MSETFFENPLYVYVTLALAELVLAVIYHEVRRRRWAVALAVPPVVALAVGLIAHFVVTDREQIVAAAENIAQAVETRRLQRIPQHLDEQFSATLGGARIGRDQVVAVCSQNLARWSISKVDLHGMEVAVAGREARMAVTTLLVYGRDGGRTSLVWNVTWIKRQDRWLILEVAEPRGGLRL